MKKIIKSLYLICVLFDDVYAETFHTNIHTMSGETFLPSDVEVFSPSGRLFNREVGLHTYRVKIRNIDNQIIRTCTGSFYVGSKDIDHMMLSFEKGNCNAQITSMGKNGKYHSDSKIFGECMSNFGGNNFCKGFVNEVQGKKYEALAIYEKECNMKSNDRSSVAACRQVYKLSNNYSQKFEAVTKGCDKSLIYGRIDRSVINLDSLENNAEIPGLCWDMLREITSVSKEGNQNKKVVVRNNLCGKNSKFKNSVLITQFCNTVLK